jgi:hypothetical protein
MPCIAIKTNKEINKETEIFIKKKLAEAIKLIPGKSETWLMCLMEDNCKLWFSGSDSDAAYIEISIFGKAPNAVYDSITPAIMKIMYDELGIPADRIYIKYSETPYWGWNNKNF